ncbi:tetratricopeptide repeat protein [Arcobacter defluvii]|uniref:Tetratricopeptide repeat protein n=3 Tax=Arcobacter defluvii TaxID=873191 RepID=A0AAE7BHG7_9BACT|nr:tetratricopeptide repeat protein [Arcobacter defluvii]QKF78016.1 tetratricopeptide repeat protein [Arcobacter defluvii]
MIKGIIKVILLLLLTLTFSACEEKSSQESKTQEIVYIATLPIPESENLRKMGLISLWYDAKYDPIPATQIGYAYANKLQDYEKALQWFEYSNSMKPTADNSAYACSALQQLKQYEKALTWCNNAISLGSTQVFIVLASIYNEQENYQETEKWLLKAFDSKNKDAPISLGYLYANNLKDYVKAEQYYKEAIKIRDLEAFHNLSRLYHHNLHDDIKASAYAIALIGTKYSQRSVLKILQKERKIPNETIKKGYELQLTSDEFPIKFKGDLGL